MTCLNCGADAVVSYFYLMSSFHTEETESQERGKLAWDLYFGIEFGGTGN